MVIGGANHRNSICWYFTIQTWFDSIALVSYLNSVYNSSYFGFLRIELALWIYDESRLKMMEKSRFWQIKCVCFPKLWNQTEFRDWVKCRKNVIADRKYAYALLICLLSNILQYLTFHGFQWNSYWTKFKLNKLNCSPCNCKVISTMSKYHSENSSKNSAENEKHNFI